MVAKLDKLIITGVKGRKYKPLALNAVEIGVTANTGKQQ